MAKRATKKTGLFLQVVGGRMGAYVETPTANSEPVTSESGKVRNYEFYESIAGKLAAVYCYDKDFGTKDTKKEVEMFVIKLINAEGNVETVSMPFNSNYAQSFIKRLENIDLSKEVEVKTFRIKDKEKSAEKGKDIFNELCLPYQDGKSIESLYKKDSDKKLPEADAKTVKEKGKPVKKYDFTAQKEALRDIIKSVNDLAKANDQKETVEALNTADHDEHIDTDAMPF